MVCSFAPHLAGLSYPINTAAEGVSQSVTISVNSFSLASYQAIVVQGSNTWGPVNLTSSSNYTVNFTPVPGGGPVSLHIINTNAAVQTIKINSLKLDSITFAPQNVLTNICSEDPYHYGFNGQMKTNEMTGVGNWNTALYWEYGTREAQRKNKDPKVNAWESPYSSFGRNPIWRSDPFGDSVKATPEAAKVIQEGLNSTLGNNNPIGYNEEKQALTIKNESEIDRSKLNKTQNEIINRYATLIRSETDIINVEMVDQTTPLSDVVDKSNKSLSLNDLQSDGITKPGTLRDDVTGAKVGTITNVYISKNPNEVHNGMPRKARPYIPALTSIHEIAGHAWIFVTKGPAKSDDEENKNNGDVTRFENSVRKIYYWNGLKIGGWAEPHPGEK